LNINSKITFALLLFFILLGSNKSIAQDKGRWIITVNHAKAITHVDSLKFKDFDTRSYSVGTYKVKSWRPGGILVDTSITVRKDSISFLKIRINDTQAYAKYKSDKVIFQLKRWVPKTIVILSAIILQSNYKIAKSNADNLEKTYLDYKLMYDDLYNKDKVEEVKIKSQAVYNDYLKAVKKQNRNSALRLIVPALIASSVIIDFTNKKPQAYIETPLLSFSDQFNQCSEGNYGFSLICKF
jgi:hypothetical protein